MSIRRSKGSSKKSKSSKTRKSRTENTVVPVQPTATPVVSALPTQTAQPVLYQQPQKPKRKIPVVGITVSALLLGGAFMIYRFVSGGIGAITGVFGGVFGGIGNFLTQDIPNFFGGVGDFFVKDVGGVLSKAGDDIGDFFVKDIGGVLGKAGDDVGDFFGGIGDDIGGSFVNPTNWDISSININLPKVNINDLKFW